MKLQNVMKMSKASVVAMMALGAMGCPQDAQPVLAPARPKRIVEIGKIEARPIHLPSGDIFDLEFVVNQQFPHVLVGTNQYSIINRDAGQRTTIPENDAKDRALARKVGVVAEKWHISKEAECLVNVPQFHLGGAITSYEWVSSMGLRIGYTPAGNSKISNVGADIKIDKAEMSMHLGAYQAIDGSLLETMPIVQKQSKTKIGFNIGVGPISIGPEFYYQKGLARVTQEALEAAINGLREKTDKMPWYTRVGYREENFMSIIGGSNVNLKVGDVVTIHNARYFWEDNRVCDPDAFRGSLDGDPVAEGTIVEVSPQLSRVKIDQMTIGNEDPLTGSVVKIKRLVDAK